MLNSKPPDSKALKLLRNYSELAQRHAMKSPAAVPKYVRGKPTTPDDFQYMVAQGVAFPVVAMAHDEAVDRCFSAYHAKDKQKFSDLFVSGLGQRRPDWRSGLSAFAIMQSMPRHDFKPNRAGCCEICSGYRFDEQLDLTALNRLRYFIGSMLLLQTPYQMQFFLEQANLLESRSPSVADREVLRRVLDVARHAEDATTPNDLQKALKNIDGLKISTDEARAIVEILGLCGVLQTDDHRGYLERYTNPGMAPHKSHSSDWAYPVDFWTGADGVNEEAVDFWFGV